jgi:hypothetical protein
MVTGSLFRVTLVARKLMRQNRIVLSLMLLWPCVLSAIVLGAFHGAPAKEDVVAILEQELFYGMVLVGLGASVALGTERKANRTQQVLGRAVSRTEYLLALGLSAWLPLAAYLLLWAGNAEAFALLLHAGLPRLSATLVAAFSAGLLVCTAGLLLSTVLPQLGAAACTGLVLAGLAGAGRAGWHGIPGIFGMVTGLVQPAAVPWSAAAETVGASLLVLLAAALCFSRKDLV